MVLSCLEGLSRAGRWQSLKGQLSASARRDMPVAGTWTFSGAPNCGCSVKSSGEEGGGKRKTGNSGAKVRAEEGVQKAPQTPLREVGGVWLPWGLHIPLAPLKTVSGWTDSLGLLPASFDSPLRRAAGPRLRSPGQGAGLAGVCPAPGTRTVLSGGDVGRK